MNNDITACFHRIGVMVFMLDTIELPFAQTLRGGIPARAHIDADDSRVVIGRKPIDKFVAEFILRLQNPFITNERLHTRVFRESPKNLGLPEWVCVLRVTMFRRFYTRARGVPLPMWSPLFPLFLHIHMTNQLVSNAL